MRRVDLARDRWTSYDRMELQRELRQVRLEAARQAREIAREVRERSRWW